VTPSPEVEQFEQNYQEFLASDTSLHDLVESAEDPDEPLNALRAVGLLHRWLDDVEDDMALKARVELASWSTIGVALGRSNQAVWKRHHDSDDVSPDD